MNEQRINHHHLHSFWAVAKDGNLTHTARELGVAQSALSAQIKQLEAHLGAALFLREGRKLVLTEAGQLALGYAEKIFGASHELLSTIQKGRDDQDPLRIGSVATLSRNFQDSFIHPLFAQPDLRLRMQSGSLEELLGHLANHSLDIVLSNRPVQSSIEPGWRCRRIARQPVSLVGHRRRKAFRFPQDLKGIPLIVPGPDSDMRTEFDALCEQLGVRLRIRAEVDDMATMRLLARDTESIALLPSVVVRDELKNELLFECCVVPGIFETFYAITIDRDYPHPMLRSLLARDEAEILGMLK